MRETLLSHYYYTLGEPIFQDVYVLGLARVIEAQEWASYAGEGPENAVWNYQILQPSRACRQNIQARVDVAAEFPLVLGAHKKT